MDLGQRVRACRRAIGRLYEDDDHECGRFSRRMVRVGCAQGPWRQWYHRQSRRPFSGYGLRASASLYGRNRWCVSSMASQKGAGQISLSIASAAQEYGAEIRTNASVDHVIIKNGQAGRCSQRWNGTACKDRRFRYGSHLTFRKFVGTSISIRPSSPTSIDTDSEEVPVKSISPRPIAHTCRPAMAFISEAISQSLPHEYLERAAMTPSMASIHVART